MNLVNEFWNTEKPLSLFGNVDDHDLFPVMRIRSSEMTAGSIPWTQKNPQNKREKDEIQRQKKKLSILFPNNLSDSLIWHYAREKKNHRSTGWGRKGLLEDIWSDHPAQARPPRAGCPGAYPDSFCIFPKREKPQCLWATFASAPSPSQLKTVSWCSDRRSCVALCARWLLSHHWTPLERV